MVEEYETKGNSGGASAVGCFPETFALEDGDKHNKCVKRMKFSAEPDTSHIVAPRRVHKEIVMGTYAADMDFVCQTMTLHLVETSCQGVTSSCYLLDKQVHSDIGGDALNLEAPKYKLPDASGHLGKEAVVGTSAASPVSQESFETKVLLASPSLGVLGKFVSPLHVVESEKEFDSLVLDASNRSNTDSKKDPRPFLQRPIIHILLAMGWNIERRKRPSRKYIDTVYRSPDGRMFRDFPKVWRLCGQVLFAGRCSLAHENNVKEWAGINDFWSDLLNVLMSIEKEKEHSDHADALAHQWSHLDPFVKVVFIDRKVGSLRKGYPIKATESSLTDDNEKNDATEAWENENGEGNLSSVTNLSACDPVKTTSTICEGSYQAADGQSGVGGSFDLIDVSIRVVDRAETALAVGSQTCNICKDNTRNLDSTPSLACGSDGTVQLCSCQRNVPVVVVNANSNGGAASVSPQQDSNLVDLDDSTDHEDFNYDETTSTQFVSTEILKHPQLSDEEQCVQVSMCQMKDKTDVGFKKKTQRKSKKISEIRSSMLSQRELLIEEKLAVNLSNKRSCKKSSPHRSGSKFKKMHSTGDSSKNDKKKPNKCLIKDDDLLVSAIIRKKYFLSGGTRSVPKKKAAKVKAQKPLKYQKGRCRLLLRNLGKLGKHCIGSKWALTGPRSVLSWLINAGGIPLNAAIQYRNPKNDAIIKYGLVSKDGILCTCCNMLFSVSKFKHHAGFNLTRPCLNLVMDSGESFTLCQLQAWSAEYKSRKRRSPVVRDDEDDENDDSCGLCGEGGELICCDNCPSTFHQACMSTEDLPEGNWYCSNCTCRICQSLVIDKEGSSSYDAYKCSQCEHKYHRACQKGKNTYIGTVPDIWFCSGSCQEVFTSLHSHVGIINHIVDGLCWTLLRCIHEDQKVHSAQRLAMKAECNSKLAVSLTIMEECFQSMVDARTGIDMIPHLLYNWGSEFARLNFHGFYTMVLEKDDIFISVASIRVHGVQVAEMPLIATCSKYRRQGMCRRLMTAIEEMLVSMKVEKLVISAIPDLVDTWVEGFGFIHVSNFEKQSLNKINLMVFPGSVLLIKQMYKMEARNEPCGSDGIGEIADEQMTQSE